VRVFNHEPWGEAWTPDTAHTYLRDLRDTPRSAGLVAEVEGSVVGFVLGHTEQRDTGAQFYLAEMCVLSEYQGQGVGRRLLGMLEAVLSRSVAKLRNPVLNG
jgi:GNAT superfamily N-acetyltransferase